MDYNPEGKKNDYRGFIGSHDNYDLISANQFNLLSFLGLREDHYLLDIGCGSLRGGRLFIPFLLPKRYYGIEPEQWLIDEGIKNEMGKDILKIKKPVFNNNNTFKLSVFNKKFDYILAHSIFSHASEKQIKRCLEEARKVMKPTSLFIATFAKGKENYSGEDWVYPGFVMYTEDHMKALFREHGLASAILRWPHPEFQVWIVAALENKNNNYNGKNSRFTSLNSEIDNINKRMMSDREALFDLYFQIEE
jgi:cyclopropane fatty-acyl-phospholipid synthase-like methyltransferase